MLNSLVNLKNLLADISTDLTYYRQIFGSEENVSVLKSVSDWVFANYQKCLINSIYSKLSRLLDPKSSCGSDNLSFAYVIDTFSLASDSEVNDSLSIIKDIYKSSGLKKYRDKVLSHNDAHIVLCGSKCDVNFNDDSLGEFLTRLWDLFCLLQYKTGLEDSIVKYSSEILIPAEMDGITFVQKLKKCI
ncbi:MAG: hypothetical protein ACRDAR_10805 [Aeromonas veronii]